MTESTRVFILAILGLFLFLTLSFLISRVLMKQAILKIIKTFRLHQALDVNSAITQGETGIKRRGFLEFRGFRDYTPNAFQLLVKHNIIQVTDEGKFYLSEDKLALTSLEKPKTDIE